MKLFRFQTQLNHGQRWSNYDVLGKDIASAMKRAEKIIKREEGLTGKPVKFQDQVSGPKEVDIVGVEVLSERVWSA